MCVWGRGGGGVGKKGRGQWRGGGGDQGSLLSLQAVQLGNKVCGGQRKASPQQRMLLSASSHTCTGIIHDNLPPEQSMLRGNAEKTIVYLTKQILSAPVLTFFTSCHHSLMCRVFTDWKRIVRKKGLSPCVLDIKV